VSGLAMVRALDGRRLVNHVWLTCSGTGAAPGTGYCSWVIQGAINCGVNVVEYPVQSPWSFGVFPVAGATDPMAASYKESVLIGYADIKRWLSTHPRQTFGLAGYSQGATPAAMAYLAMMPGGELEQFYPYFIGAFTFGNPWRMAGHTYPSAIPVPGEGIAPQRMTLLPADLDRWHDHVNCKANGAVGDDLYTTKPHDGSGRVEEAVYTLAGDQQIHDLAAWFGSMVTDIVGIVGQLGGGLPVAPLGGIGGLQGGLVGGAIGAGMVGGILGGLLGSAVPGASILGGELGPGSVIPVKPGGNVPVPAGVTVIEAVQAAVRGLEFVLVNPPTAPHITYEFTDALPGRPGYTHINHAADHVIDCCRRVPATTLA
jgi:hypothetical protein